MEIERTIRPTDDERAAFEREEVSRKPIVMVNLLRFLEVADYDKAGMPSDNVSGRKAYARYSRDVIKLLWQNGGQVLWGGKVRAGVILPSYERWDEVVLVYYPNRQAFANMVSSDAYKAIEGHRMAAIEDSRLIETHPMRLPRVALKAARIFTRGMHALGIKK